MMWGDAERALKFDSPISAINSSDGANSSSNRTDDGDVDDPLIIFLYQVTGPLHISYTDPIWLELLHGYNIWVHLTIQQHPTTINYNHNHQTAAATESSNDGTNSQNYSTSKTIIENACQRMVQYSIHTSNMAALSLHIIRLLNEYMTQLQPQLATTTTTVIHHNENSKKKNSQQQRFTNQANRNSRRPYNNNITTPLQPQQQQPQPATATTAGTSYESSDPNAILAFSNRIALVEKARALAGAINLYRIFLHTLLSSCLDENNDDDAFLEQIFTYTCRETDTQQSTIAMDLLNTVLQFICCCCCCDSNGNHNDHTHHQDNSNIMLYPEVYDCYSLVLQLFVVLLSTQLYQPLQSSFQTQNQLLLQQQQQKGKTKIQPPTTSTKFNFWNILLQEANRRNRQNNQINDVISWSPRQLLHLLLSWYIHQPIAPIQSIQYHHCTMIQQLVLTTSSPQQGGHTTNGGTPKLGPDKMYEHYSIVHAIAPNTTPIIKGGNSVHTNDTNMISPSHRPDTLAGTRSTGSGRSLALFDATKGAIVFSSKMLLLLPLRLMSLALSLWGLQQNQHKNKLLGYDQQGDLIRQMQQRNRQYSKNKRRTRDVLWLSMSPIADLSTSILLLLTNNERHSKCNNIFRTEMMTLSDNRWDDNQQQHGSSHYDLPDLPDTRSGSAVLNDHSQNGHEEDSILSGLRSQSGRMNNSVDNDKLASSTTLTINFERLFSSFGRTAHTEPGALWLYTLLQLSPSFASAIAVRSDLDTIVLPLLRTLYYATTSTQYHTEHGNNGKSNKNHNTARSIASGTNGSAPSGQVAKLQDNPYRSQSQLYVIIILLLLLSQDASFGSDAFRRVSVPIVPWYKERYLKDIRLGSILILQLLRSLTFNLTRQHDAFLLTNCCAVLMNLSSSMVELYDYSAMKFVTTTIAFMKRYIVLRQQNPKNNDDDITTPTSMYGEASRTLLCVLKQCLGPKSIEKNLHLVYALVYHQADFVRIFGSKDCPFSKSEVSLIQNVTNVAVRIIDQDGSNARTAQKALKALSEHMYQILDVVVKESSGVGRNQSRNDLSVTEEDFTFTYEEEADPEIFFVPYVWEVIVCVMTSTSMEWDKNRIRVFPLLDVADDDDFDDDNNEAVDEVLNNDINHSETQSMIPHFARDVTDVV